MAEAVYVLCALTSLACAVLLLRGYLRNRAALLLWSSLCFSWFAINNAFLFLDKVVIKDVDLGILRALSGFIALAFLMYGLVTESGSR
jgi:hypothetical protein